MVRVLALDPGESTGWALFKDEEMLQCGVISSGLNGYLSWAALAMPVHDVLVVEEFIVEPDYVGRAYASEIVGAAVALSPARIVRQLRSMKATLVRGTEAQRFAWLSERGFTGESHALDAITHALLYLRRSGNKAAVRKYWA